MQNENQGYDRCVRAYNALADACADVTDRLTSALESRFGLSISEFDVLLALGGHELGGDGLAKHTDGALQLHSLLDQVRLSQPALSRLVDRLQARGLVIRFANENDKRGVNVRITEKGRLLLDAAVPVHARCIRESLLDKLTVDERIQFKTILMKISGQPADQHDLEKAL